MKLLHDLIVGSAAARPEQVALYAGAQRTTYRQLDELIARVADGLHALGIARRDRVAVFLPKCVEAVATMASE